jgi:hypothetical protein
MARHYSTRDFFRQMPNALLARYFGLHQVLVQFDFEGAKEAQSDTLFSAWLELSDATRNAMDAEFREIFELSCEKGWRAIIDEADFHLEHHPDKRNAFVEELASLSNHFERAMVAFLEHKEYWRGASLFYHADTLSHWRKRKNLPHVAAAVDDASLQDLASRIRNYFRLTEGRGKNCVVEPFRRGELDYFFAYPEDYSQQSIEWVEGEFDRRPHNPAFEVIFVYSQEKGTLDLSFRGSYKAVEPLQQAFAASILKLPELPPDPKDGRVYDLNPLRQRSFDFVFGVGTGIQDVILRKLRLSSKVRKGDRITLEADTSRDPDAVYALLDKIATAVQLDAYNVTQVELAAQVIVDATKPAKAVRITITHPNSCSLKYDETDLKLREMLHASGIEPKESLRVPE